MKLGSDLTVLSGYLVLICQMGMVVMPGRNQAVCRAAVSCWALEGTNFMSVSIFMYVEASNGAPCVHASTFYYENKYLGMNFRIRVPVGIMNIRCFLFCFVQRYSRKDFVFASV